jgi:hypothetical protein
MSNIIMAAAAVITLFSALYLAFAPILGVILPALGALK